MSIEAPQVTRASVTSIQQGADVVRLPGLNDCPVSAALARIAAAVRNGDIVGVSVVITARDGSVRSEKLCSPSHY